MNGYIKLHRKLIEWEWYSDMKVSRVFIHLLLLASFKDSNWRGQGIKKGQVITSYPSLSKQLGFSVQEIRTTFKKLSSTNDINSKATGRNLLITLVNFEGYQSNDTEQQQDSNRESTGLQQDSNRVATGNQQHRKNVKKDKKFKNVNNVKNKESKEPTPKPETIQEFTKRMDVLEKSKTPSSKSWTKLEVTLHNYTMKFSEPINEALVKYWKYMEDKKGQNWGTKTTITMQVDLMNKHLKTFSEKEVLESLFECMERGNASYNPLWTKNRNEKEKSASVNNFETDDDGTPPWMFN